MSIRLNVVRRLFVGLVAAGILVLNAGYGFAGTGNLVENSSFEILKDGMPEGWRAINNIEKISVDNDIVYHGENSIHFKLDGELTRFAMAKNIEFSPDKPYTFSIMVKTKNLRPTGAFNIHLINAGWTWSSPPLKIESTSDWQRHALTFSIPESVKIRWASVQIRSKGATGEVWIDAVQVEEGSQATEYQAIEYQVTECLVAAFLPGYKAFSAVMPRTEWPDRVSPFFERIFEHMPLNVSVFKLDPAQEALGFQWPDGRIILVRFQEDSWVVFKGKAGNLQEVAKVKVRNPELIFYGTGILLQKDGKSLAAIDYGINNLDVRLFIPADSCDNISFDNVNILHPSLQWRFLALAEGNLQKSAKLLRDNQRYIIATHRGKKHMIDRWESNLKTLRRQIEAKRKSIISQTGTFLPPLMQIPVVYDGYTGLVQFADMMKGIHHHFGTFFQDNWFKSLGGMPSHQYSVDLKRRVERLVARARCLGDVAFKRGVAIEQNGINILAAGFTDSLSTVFKHKAYTGNFSPSFLMKLSKGESECLQLILRTGLHRDVENISIEIGPISGPGTISRDQISFYLMRQIRLVEPWTINLPATGGGDTRWPDPLRPWENNKEFSISARNNQVIWLTLQAPEEALAGEYKFNIKIKLKGAVVAELPVHFRIFDFALGRNRLMNVSGFRFRRDWWEKFFGDNVDKAKRNFQRVLLEHHMNPISLYELSPPFEDVEYLMKKGLDMVSIYRFEFIAAPRKGMTEFVKLYASNDGKKFKRIPAEVKLVPQAGDINIVDWDLVLKPEYCLKDYKYIKVHNSETRGWGDRVGQHFFRIDTLAESIVLSGDELVAVKIKDIRYYLMDKTPTVGGGGELIVEPGRNFGFDCVRLGRGRASIVIARELGVRVNKIRLINSNRSQRIPVMKEQYRRFREIGGEELNIMSYGFDEVGEHLNPEILSGLRAVRRLFPDVVTVSTALGVTAMPEIFKYLDYLVPGHLEFFYEKKRSLSDKYGANFWLYVGGGRYYPFPSFERVDQPRINSRAFFWVLIRYDLKGWLYWAINMWRFNVGHGGSEVVIKEWPEIWEEWDPSWSFYTSGMGALLYPGPNYTPMPSARLKALRDGIEDFNFFKIAEEMLATRKFNNPEQQKEIADFLKKAKHTLSPGLSGFLKNIDEFNKIRNRLASYIEKMNRLPLK